MSNSLIFELFVENFQKFGIQISRHHLKQDSSIRTLRLKLPTLRSPKATSKTLYNEQFSPLRAFLLKFQHFDLQKSLQRHFTMRNLLNLTAFRCKHPTIQTPKDTSEAQP